MCPAANRAGKTHVGEQNAQSNKSDSAAGGREEEKQEERNKINH